MKKLIILFIVMMLCLQVFSGTVVYAYDYQPRLETTNSIDIPVIKAGESRTLTFNILNNSGNQALNCVISVKMADESKAPLVLENFDLRQNIKSILGYKDAEVSFDLKILDSAPAGLYTMKLNLEYENAFGNVTSTSETFYIRVVNENTSPRLIVNDILINSDSGSKTVDLTLRVLNSGKNSANNIKFTLLGLKTGGFTAYNSTDIKYVDKIDGQKSTDITYKLLLPVSGAAGNNDLSLKMEYSDEFGTSYTETNQIFIPENLTKNIAPDISLENITYPKNELSANEEFEIGFDIKNNGEAAAKKIMVSLAPDQATEIVSKTMNPVYIDSVDINKSRHVTFKLFATDKAATRNYPIALNVEYEDGYGVKYKAVQYVGVFVRAREEKKEEEQIKTVPKIIVDKYSIEPSSVNAGEDFTLKLSFLNTSKIADTANIKVTVTSDDGTFTPTNSGNTFYIERIPVKSNVERELLLHVKPDAEQKSYMLSVNFEYEDDKGNQYTSKETISVRVLQNPRLVTGELSLPPEAYAGQPVSLYIDFYNMGKSTLYNLMVKAEGEFDGQNLSYYVGNFESGRTDFFDVSIIPTAPGQLTGNIVFSFEDANGKTNEIRKEFTLNVMEMTPIGPAFDENGMPIDNEGMPGANPAAPKSMLVYVIPAVAVIVIAAVVFIVLRKRHIRRKEMTLDE